MINLIRARTDDVSALQEICRRAYSEVFSSHWLENGMELYLEKEFNERRLNDELTRSSYDYFFITHNSAIIGFAKVNYQSDSELSELANCELDKIYILPGFSGQGIGQFALNQLIEEVRSRSKKMFFLCVIDTNKSAIKFYKKMGFRFHSRTRLEIPLFREELKGMHRMCFSLESDLSNR